MSLKMRQIYEFLLKTDYLGPVSYYLFNDREELSTYEASQP
jgi:hypothetical protein